jgi:sugar phosphate isomerase/epimerase
LNATLNAMADLARLCVHQVTLMEQCDFRQSVACLARNGVTKTAVWCDKLAAIGTTEAASILGDHGVEAVALCPGGHLTDRDPAAFHSALDNNRRWLDQAAAIGAASLVTITGGLGADETDLRFARDRALEGLATLVPEARAAGVRLALEPLHPMVCGYRSVISTLREANAWLDRLDAGDVMGIALDTYAVWWEPDLQREIARAGPRIIAFHVSDWLADTSDVRLDRGMPGDGLIDLPAIRGWVEAAGYRGPIEVEIFSRRNWWTRDADDVVRTILHRYGRDF